MNPPDSTALPADFTATPPAGLPPEETDLLLAAGIRFEWYRDGFRLLLALLGSSQKTEKIVR